MDSLKLEMHAVDEVYPHLKDLMDSLNKISIVLPDHIAKVKVCVGGRTPPADACRLV